MTLVISQKMIGKENYFALFPLHVSNLVQCLWATSPLLCWTLDVSHTRSTLLIDVGPGVVQVKLLDEERLESNLPDVDGVWRTLVRHLG